MKLLVAGLVVIVVLVLFNLPQLEQLITRGNPPGKGPEGTIPLPARFMPAQGPEVPSATMSAKGPEPGP